MLKRNATGLRGGKSKRVDQSSPDQQKTSMESIGAAVARAAKSRRGRPREATRSQTPHHLVVRSHTSGLSWTVTVLHTPDFLTNWFVDSTKFLADDDTAGDDATVCLITDVSMVQQMERLFVVMDSNSLSVDFDGQVPRDKTLDLPDHALSGDWGSAEHVTKTSARICFPGGVAMFQGAGEHMAEECNVSYDRVFASVTVIVVVSLGTKLAQAEGEC